MENPSTGRRDLRKYREEARNQLANCMLLSQDDNGPRGKSAKAPDEWFASRTPEYLDMHLIPRDPSLWKLERFEDFLEERKKLIREKFAYLLVPDSARASGKKGTETAS